MSVSDLSGHGLDGVCIPNIILKSALTERSGLNIGQFNSRSIFKKMDEIRNIFSNINLHIIGVTETWLKPHVPDSAIRLNDFQIFRNDRTTHAGGVMFYVRCGIKATVITQSSSACIEYLFLELIINRNKLLVGVVYNPKRSNNLSSFYTLLSQLSSQYKDVIITGDFNKDLLNLNIKRSLEDNLNNIALFIYPTYMPTHFIANASPTLLDIFLTSNVSKIVFYDQLSLGISDHDFIYISYNIPITVEPTQPIFIRDFSKININTLEQQFSALSWTDIYYCSNIDDMLTIFNHLISLLLNHNVPFKQISLSNNKNPKWFKNYIKKSILERDLAYNAWKRNRTQENLLQFRRLRNLVTSQVRYEKRKFWTLKLKTKSSKKLWSSIRSMGICHKNKDVHIDISPDSLNNFFTSSQKTDSLRFPYNYCLNDPSNAFQLRNVSPDEVRIAISKIKTNAVGLDEIPLSFIKILLPMLLPYITHIFNFCITSSTFPFIWKTAKLIPIPKQNNQQSVSDFRPISILPSLSKALESLINSQLSEYLLSSNFISNDQSGFRNKRSTTSALLKITNDLYSAMDRQCASLLVLLDFAKAFDSVNHSILLEKLSAFYNFSENTIKLISSYLNNRFQTVYLNSQYSNLSEVKSGIPQGSILGPTLFLLFINDLPSVLHYTNCHLFADDVQLYASSKVCTISETFKNINTDLQNVTNWSLQNGLFLNPKKSQTLLIAKTDIRLNADTHLEINNENIPFVTKVKNLGVIINTRLKWNDHISNICKKVYFSLRTLWSVSDITPVEARRKLVIALLLPLFTYADLIFSQSLDFNSQRKLNVAFNSCARYIFNIRRYNSISEYSVKIIGCSLTTLYKYRMCLSVYKIIKFKEPLYLYTQLQFARSARTCHLIVPVHSSSAMNSSYFVRAVVLWNSLPIDVRRAGTVAVFEILCKRHFNVFIDRIA